MLHEFELKCDDLCQKLKLLLFNIEYERKLDYRIADIDGNGIIIPFLDGKFHVYFIQSVKKCLMPTKFNICDQVNVEVSLLFGS